MFSLLVCASIAVANDRETVIVSSAVETLEEAAKLPERHVPAFILRDAEGFVVIPNLVKVGFVVGGKHGRGVAVMKNPGGVWSNPVMIKLTGGSIGWQAGVESSDLLLVVRKRKTVEEMLTARKFTLGANAGLAVGPLGRDLQSKTDVQFKAEMYSYSRSRGLFAGVAIEGGSVRVDDLGNRKLYGSDLPALQLATSNVPVPAEVVKLRQTLTQLSPPPPPPTEVIPIPPAKKP